MMYEAAMRQANYDARTPLCRTCVDFVGKRKSGTKGQPIRPFCIRFMSNVSDVGCCDHWHGKNGEALA